MSQIDIFPRPRPKVGNRAVEFRLQCAIARLLRQHINKNWIFTHIPLGEKRDPATGARLKAMGTNAGWPDLVFVAPGRTVFLELKRRSGKLSPEQAEIATHLMRSGCGYACVDTFKDAVEALQDFGILPLTIHPQ